MPSFDSQDKCFKCPTCGAENFDFASFCISCGSLMGEEEVTISNSEANSPLHTQITPDTERSHSLRYMQSRWEFCIGILLLVFVMGYILNDWQQSNVRS